MSHTSRPGRWFEPIAAHLDTAYLRYSFTMGTEQEAGFLADELGLGAGARVLDVGCGPGRHLRALRARGAVTVGVDISETFCRLVAQGDPPAPVVRADARSLPFPPVFDVVMSLCQGGFGLLGGPGADADADVGALRAMASCLRPGGRLVVSAFSSYFQVRYLEDHDTFDVDAGVNHERTVVKSPTGDEAEVDLWTTGFTPRELRLAAAAAGLVVDAVWSVNPGDYRRRPPDLDHAEFLLVARRS